MSEQFLATAQVLITPNTKGFRAQLLAELKKATTKPIAVRIVPDTKGFATAVNTALRALTLAPVKVLILPDTSKFRAALDRELKTATAGAAVAVPVAPVGSSTGTGAATGQAAAQLSREQQVQQQITREFQKAESERLAATKAAHAQRIQLFAAREAAERAAAAAISSRATAEIAQFRQLETVENKIQAARQAGLAARAKVLGADSAEAAAERQLTLAKSAEKKAQDALTASLLLGNQERVREARLIHQNAAALILEKEAALSSARAQAVRTTQLSAVRRALQAQAATLAGLRGAALSAQGAFLAAAAATVVFVKAVQSAARLESQLNVFRVTTGATADEMERVSEEARRLGSDVTLPAVGASDAAEAFSQLARAGLSVQDSLDGARGVLQLATAAEIDNAQATELAASALNAFGLAGDQAVRVADVLANSANQSQGSIVDMGVALQQSAAVARQAGLSLEQTVAALTLFARNGLRGSDAGTSLRTALIRLINPTDKAQEVINKLGLRLRTVTGAIDLTVFDQFTRSTRNLTKAQRDQALAIIFGQDAIRGAAILAREGAEGLDVQTEALGRQGTAAELANARMAGLTGSMENLKNQLSTLGLTIGQVVIPPLKLLTDGLASAVQGANAFAQGLIDVIRLGKQAAQLVPDIVPDVEIGPVNTKQFENQLIDLGKKAAKNAPRIGLAIQTAGVSEAVRFGRQQIENFRTLKGDASEVGAEVRKILASLNDISEAEEGIRFLVAVEQLAKLQERLANGDKEARRLSGSVADIIAKLQQGQTLPPFVFPQIELPDELQSGEPGKEAGEAITDAFDKALPGDKLEFISFNAFKNVEVGIRNALLGAVSQVTASVQTLFSAAQAAVAAGETKTIRDAELRIGALQEQATDIDISGGTDAQRIRNLQNEFKTQQRIIDTLTGKLGKEAKDKRRAAKDRQAAINDEIKGIEEKARTDAETAKREAQTARDKADQAFLDSLSAKSGSLGTRELEADLEGNLQRQLALARQRKRLSLDQIALIQEHVSDRKVAAERIQALRNEVLRAESDIRNFTQQIADAATERLGRKLEIARINENSDAILAALKQIVANARERLARARVAKAGVEAANLALRQAIKDLRDEQQSVSDEIFATLEQRIELAGLRGHENEQLRLIDRAIANRKREVKRLRGLGKSTLDVQLEIERLIDQREEIKKTASDAKGTTAFELLQQAAETFTTNAGNLIGVDQPFAGPTGFTADLAQFLKRRKTAGGATSITPPTAAGKSKLEINDDRLVRALERLADATERANGGNASTATGTNPVSTNIARKLANAFYESRAANRSVEADTGGGI